MAKRKSQPPQPDATASEMSVPTKPRRRSKADAPEAPGAPVELPADSAPPPHTEPVVSETLRPDQAPAQEADVDPTEDDIRRRAYERYLERGGGHGSDEEDWLHAEQELRRKR